MEPDNLKSRCYELDESSITQYSLDIAIASNCSTELKVLFFLLNWCNSGLLMLLLNNFRNFIRLLS